MNYNELFTKLSNTSSRLEKEFILNEHKADELLKKIFLYALDPFFTFYIKKIPDYNWTKFGPSRTLEEAVDALDRLKDRTYTGNAAQDYLRQILESCENTDDVEVIKKIIAGDFRCGVGGTIANKVWPGLIREFPVMLATASSPKVNAKMVFPAAVQLKLDGMRFTCVQGTIHSRSGKVYDGADPLAKLFPDLPYAYDGELWVDDGTGKPMPRSKGNGIITKALKGTISEKEANLINCTVWDIIPLEDWEKGRCDIPYVDRLKLLVYALHDVHPKIHVIETHIVQNFDDVNVLFANSLEAGEEGVMVKALNEPWTDDRVKHQIKYKAERSADLRCVGWEFGKGKYANKVGKLKLETSDRLIAVSVGSGLKDDDREKDGAYYLGRIVEIVYNERIKADSDKKESLFLPRFICVREDKDVANSAEELT